jgi:sugar O-acyltransferase (sialic acid O-acetyltransferase NeuD family)
MAKAEKILVWGGKSQARIIESMLREKGRSVSFIFDPFLKEACFKTDAIFGHDIRALQNFLKEATHFVVGIGGEHGMARAKLSLFLEKKFGLSPLTIKSDFAFSDGTSTIGSGFQAMPGAVLHKFCRVGNYVLINTNAAVDHECNLGDGVHIMGGAALAGCVTVKKYATIGTNATILPHLTIGEGALVGAGAVVTKDVPDFQVVAGVPARLVRKIKYSVDLSLLEACELACKKPRRPKRSLKK